MNNFNFLKPLAVLTLSVVLSCTGLNVMAQYVPAMLATAVTPGGPYPGVQNTGNDITPCSFCGNNEMKVMVYDGATPSLSWDDGAGNVGSLPFSTIGAFDPDVVVGMDGTCALAVYQAGGFIYFEQYMWTGTAFALNIGPAVVSAPGSRHPNIDQLIDCTVTATWETWNGANWEVFADCGTVCAGLAGGAVNVSAAVVPVGMDAIQPDVSMFMETGTGTRYSNFTYIMSGPGGTTTLTHQMEAYATICGGASAPVFVSQPFTMAAPDFVAKPRIASELGLATVTPQNHSEIVCQVVAGGNQYIIGHHNVAGTQQVNGVPLPLDPCGPNALPVVTWTSCGLYNVGWQFDDFAGCLAPAMPAGSALEVLGGLVDPVGNVVTAQYFGFNIPFTGNQYHLSLAGKYSKSMLVTYFDDTNPAFGNYVHYKCTPCNGMCVREDVASIEEAEEANSIKAFPIPANDFIYLNITGDDAIKTVRIMDMSGKLIKQLAVNHLSNGTISLSTEGISSGIYFLEVESTTKTENIKITVAK